MLSINTNISSLIVKSNLSTSTKGLNQAIERMTTGFKINSAKDNAANYSIATNLNTKLNSYMVAEENAVMGLNLVETASSSLEMVNGHLSRVRDLAEQASNGTYSANSLSAIQAEIDARLEEIDRIIANTEYNGIRLLSSDGKKSQRSKTLTGYDENNSPNAHVDNAPDATSGSLATALASGSAGDTVTYDGCLGSDGNCLCRKGDIDCECLDSPYSIDQGGQNSYPGGSVGSCYTCHDAGDCDCSGMQEKEQVREGFVSDVSRLTAEMALARDYVLIETAEDLNKIKDNLSGKYILMNDIDMSGINWDPIEGTFTGTLNGNGYAIKNLTINNTDDNSVGFFEKTYKALIQNIGFENINIVSQGEYTSVFNGNYTDFENTYVTGTLKGSGYVGTFASSAPALTFEDCYADIDITIVSQAKRATTNVAVGGLVGETKNIYINNSFVTGNITVEEGVDTSKIGGMVGYNTGFNNIVDSFVDISSNASIAAYQGNEAQASSFSLIGNSSYNSDKLSSSAYSSSGKTTAELQALIQNGALPYAVIPVYTTPDINFHIGINAGDGSTITVNTAFDFNLSVDVTTNEAARNSITEIDRVIKQVADKQAQLGSATNRLMSAIESINVNIDNMTSSLSTIRDADIAEETSEYLRMQILQQASATLLATANQTPALALQLI